MSPQIRKVALIAHVTCSVGWLGAVAGFLALAIVGLAGSDSDRVRAMYVAMELDGWYVIVPLSFASFATGLIMSLATEWGLFRHYWILIKLVINVLATAVLLLHMGPIGDVAAVAAHRGLEGAGLGKTQIQLIADAGAALLVLLVATALSVIKPRGLTGYGHRQRRRDSAEPTST